MKKTFLTLFAIVLTGIFVSLKSQVNTYDEGAAALKLRTAESMIENFYVDDVNADTIVEEAIRAMLKTLDPHSQYSTADETRELDEPLQGNFSGIGISFNNPTDTVIVIQPTAGGPAEKVGMLPGDRVIMVNDTVISGVKMPKSQIMKRIRGPKGSQVKISVMRLGEPELLEFVIIRDDIPIHSVEASYMIDDEVGYVRITRFAENTPDEMYEALEKLQKQGMKHLIIDLEDNGGGYLSAATELADIFLKKGDRVVFTQSSRMRPRYYVTERDGDFTDGRLVILVNQNSASASEILSGALQDNDRAVIVGRRTFGKGLVQRPFRFNDGSMIRLTIARYYTPSGRCIQKPYTKGDESKYREDIAERYKRGELTSADSIHFDESKLYHTRAGRPVYADGGIMPDRFVPLDTTAFTKWYRNVLGKSILVKYTLGYVDSNRDRIKKEYKTESDYLEKFEVTPAMLDDIVAMSKQDGVEFDQEQFDLSKDYLKDLIKALVGRDIYKDETYYKVMNRTSPIFRSAYQIITTPDTYQSLLSPPAE